MQTKANLEGEYVNIKAESFYMKQWWGAPIPPFQRSYSEQMESHRYAVILVGTRV